jgi:hypothetical protein
VRDVDRSCRRILEISDQRHACPHFRRRLSSAPTPQFSGLPTHIDFPTDAHIAGIGRAIGLPGDATLGAEWTRNWKTIPLVMFCIGWLPSPTGTPSPDCPIAIIFFIYIGNTCFQISDRIDGFRRSNISRSSLERGQEDAAVSGSLGE